LTSAALRLVAEIGRHARARGQPRDSVVASSSAGFRPPLHSWGPFGAVGRFCAVVVC